MSYRPLVFGAAAVAALALSPRAAAQSPAQTEDLAAPDAEESPAERDAEVAALAEEVGELRERVVALEPAADGAERALEAIADLEEELATLRREAAEAPEVADALEDLDRRIEELEGELGRLRAQVADLEQPVVVPPPDADVERGDGFSWATGDRDYSLTLWGRFQPRYQVELGDGASELETQTLALERARLGLFGHVAGPSLRYVVQFDLQADRPLFDAHLDYEVDERLVLRAGQYKVPHTRAFLTSGGNLGFAERPAVAEALRYDRDMAASAHGQFFGDRLRYHAGAANASGRNRLNVGTDLAAFLRLDGALWGEGIDHAIADVQAERELAVMTGVSLVQEAAPVPDEVGGVPLTVTDVDGDGDRDAIRVTSGSADAALAWAGLNVTLEALFRREDWGAILDHPENAAVAEWVGEGVEHYLAGYGHITYAAWERVVFGGRVGYGDRPLLGVGGRDPAVPRRADAPPEVDELLEIGAAARLYRDGTPILGLDYTFMDHELGGAGPDHRAILEAQFEL